MNHSSVLSALWTVLRLAILITVVFLIKMFVVDVYGVAGPSMEPALKNGSTIAGIKYDKTYTHAEIVLFKRPGRNEILIGRIVAIPGDTVRIEDGIFYLNGNELVEEYLDPEKQTTVSEGGYVKEGIDLSIPADKFFVMGDNREVSVDSRDWGLVPEENIEAKYLRCVIRC